MRKALKTVLLTYAFYAMFPAFGQELRTKTNAVYLTFKTPRTLTTVPTIVWNSPQLEYTNSFENTVEIEVDIKSEIPLSNIQLVLGDNVSKKARAAKKIEGVENKKSFHLKEKVYLPEGSNYLEIIAENVDGAKVSSSRNILVGMDAVADAVSIDRKDYALLIATDSYDYWNDLVNPVYDANSIARELSETYGFEVDILENANQEDILLKIKEYAKKNLKPQDQLFIFFAGHGQFDEGFGEGYIVAKNSLEVDKAKVTYISHSNLRSYINNISCNHILLTMDVCFGGTLDPVIARARGSNTSDDLTTNEFLARKLSKKTRQYITSGGKEYVSDGILGKHSPFATRFVEALKSRGGEDRILTISEIVPFLEKISQHEPRSGEFGDNEKGSDFVFVAKQN